MFGLLGQPRSYSVCVICRGVTGQRVARRHVHRQVWATATSGVSTCARRHGDSRERLRPGRAGALFLASACGATGRDLRAPRTPSAWGWVAARRCRQARPGKTENLSRVPHVCAYKHYSEINKQLTVKRIKTQNILENLVFGKQIW